MVTTDRRRGGRARGWYETDEDGIKVHWLPVEYSNRMSYPKRIRAFFDFAIHASSKAASIPADVVFATSTPLTIAIPAVHAAKRQRVPLVFEVRDLWPEAPIIVGALKNPALIYAARKLERYAYKHSARIVALSPQIEAGLLACGYPQDRIAIIPNGAELSDTDDPGLSFPMPPALDGRPLVTYVGTIGLVNEVDRLVELAARMRGASDLAFVVVGDGREADRVRALARDMNVLDFNFFMLGELPKNAIQPLLRRSVAAVVTVAEHWRLYGGALNKVADYLAAGKPVFCAFEGWQSSLVCDAGAGVYLPRDPEEASTTLLTHVRDPQWLARAGEAAKGLAVTRFNYDVLASDFEKVLKAAVEERPRHRFAGQG